MKIDKKQNIYFVKDKKVFWHNLSWGSVHYCPGHVGVLNLDETKKRHGMHSNIYPIEPDDFHVITGATIGIILATWRLMNANNDNDGYELLSELEGNISKEFIGENLDSEALSLILEHYRNAEKEIENE